MCFLKMKQIVDVNDEVSLGEVANYLSLQTLTMTP